jgi:hypothetical protein
MRKLLLIAGVAALALPSLAAAQYYHAGDLTQREDRLDRTIRDRFDTGEITWSDAHHDRGMLSDIRSREDQLRVDHDGLTADDRLDLARQLDSLDGQLRDQLGDSY